VQSSIVPTLEHPVVNYCLWSLKQCVASSAGMRSIAPEVRKRISDAAVLSSANVGTILVYYRRPMRHGHHLLNALRFLVTSAAQQPRS